MTELKVKYNGTEFSVPADTQVADLKVSMAEVFPELRNAVVDTTEQGIITFVAKAGTKGA